MNLSDCLGAGLSNYSKDELQAELARREAAQPPSDPTVPAFRVTLDILDHNQGLQSAEEIIRAFENLRYPEFISVAEVRQRNLPGWSDDNPMNCYATMDAAYNEWFKDAPVVWRRGQ